MAGIATDKGVHVEALRSLRVALTREPSVDQQEVQQAARAVADLPADVFSSGINNRLMAVILNLLENYLCRPPESIPAWLDPDLLHNLRSLEGALGGPVKADDDRPENYKPVKEVLALFCLSAKQLQVFLRAHPDIRENRLTPTGRRHSQRHNLHVLDFIAAIRGDDLIAGNPAVARRIESNLQRAEIEKKIGPGVRAYFVG